MFWYAYKPNGGMGCVVYSAGNNNSFPLQECPQHELSVCWSQFYAMRSHCLCMLEDVEKPPWGCVRWDQWYESGIRSTISENEPRRSALYHTHSTKFRASTNTWRNWTYTISGSFLMGMLLDLVNVWAHCQPPQNPSPAIIILLSLRRSQS